MLIHSIHFQDSLFTCTPKGNSVENYKFMAKETLEVEEKKMEMARPAAVITAQFHSVMCMNAAILCDLKAMLQSVADTTADIVTAINSNIACASGSSQNLKFPCLVTCICVYSVPKHN